MEAEMKACDPVLLGILSHKLDLYNSWSCQLERDEEQDRQLKQYECHSLAMETTDVRGDWSVSFIVDKYQEILEQKLRLQTKPPIFNIE